MKKFVILFFTLMLVLSSCSNSSSETTSNLGGLISKIVASSSSGSTTINYSYSGNKITETNSGTTKNVFTYSGNTIVSITTTVGQVLYYVDTFTYDSYGRVSSEMTNFYLNNSSEKKVYTYNSDATISVIIYSGAIDNATNLTRKAKIFMDVMEEITKIENYDLSNNVMSKTVYTNDAKNSPFKNILGFAKQPYFFGKLCNIITSDSFDSNNQIQSNSIFQYTYNSNNYPSSCEQKFYNSGSLTSTTTIQYFYQ